MDLLSALDLMVRVVNTGSFSAAARGQKLSQAAVARRISQLEDHFGVRLFHRTTRKLSLTNDGQTLLERAQLVLDGVEDLERALREHSASPVGLVRVGVTVAASHFLALRVPALLREHPGLRVELVVSDALGNMTGDRLDLAIRTGELRDASLVIYRKEATLQVAVAAPDYIERRGIPRSPDDLADHTCIVHDVAPDSDLWTFDTPAGPREIHVSGGFLANDARAVHLAARAGYGIARLPMVEVFDDLRSGRLVRVLSRFPVPEMQFHLVYPSRKHLAPRTRLVMNFIWEQVRQMQADLINQADASAA